jgi:serine/threonine protein kinase
MIAAVVMTFMSGPESGRTERITEFRPHLLGRGEDADVQLPFQDQEVSRCAAYLELSPEDCVLSVLPGKSRVLRNGAPAGSRCVLADGDELRFGRTVIRVSLEVQDRGCLYCGSQVASPVPRTDRWEKFSVYAHETCAQVRRESPKRIAHYEVIREIGSGGAGQVNQVYDPSERRVWALKLNLRMNDEQSRRFDREMYELQRLRHRNIIGFVKGCIDSSDTPFYIMEYARHGSLSDFAAKERSVEEQARILMGLLIEVLEGLAFLGRQGKAHRDLKPDNILVQSDNGGGSAVTAKLSDFGLIKGGDAVGITGEKLRRVGTLPFIAPEQVRSLHGVDSRADLYAAGVTFFYLFSGTFPFVYDHDADPDQICIAIQSQSRMSLGRYRPDLPARIIQAIDRACLTEPGQRFQTAGEFQNALGGRA